MIRHIPINISFDEEKIKEIADTIIKRRTSKIIKQVLKEKGYLTMIEMEVKQLIRNEAEKFTQAKS